MRLAILLLWSSSLFAADLAGIWTGQIAARNGDVQDIAFKFTQTGTTLTGKLYGEYQSAAIIEGKITGDQLDFVVIAQEQNGNQISDSRFHFTGTVKPGEIELTRERQGSTNAGNGGSFFGFFFGILKTLGKQGKRFQETEGSNLHQTGQCPRSILPLPCSQESKLNRFPISQDVACGLRVVSVSQWLGSHAMPPPPSRARPCEWPCCTCPTACIPICGLGRRGKRCWFHLVEGMD